MSFKRKKKEKVDLSRSGKNGRCPDHCQNFCVSLKKKITITVVKSITCFFTFFCIIKDGKFSLEIHLAYMDHGTK